MPPNNVTKPFLFNRKVPSIPPRKKTTFKKYDYHKCFLFNDGNILN
ncbi:hypothetical protein BTN50_0312 [Candidatus Enterovibrio altilux]|uniref:Uncharacterized protein n=1 Tax=Candidatus Enterovibrio altilux TaxID=1927128 RepID=A0A291B761_9GAMM|nr:hypothetical protein BTN50_0312 [Candidatus Enterovibrio luxaltus]